ncbi:hypothetical protein SAMN02745166_01842 [Prosthecobacter debontii]|uniref:Uncharacterized protein n=1 Tax=Prosthecobacter debontii TaxID=48467 RepID=A0A1T4XRD1_9BACT|nr:hypothetical protein [Prosthecobacter debontii]SKA92107.1 hypothetical protein SAMN02745166_01842 [Prosthecobacter debontii]
MKRDRSSRVDRFGYSSIELLTVLALSAIVIGGMVVSYGTLVRSQPQVASVVEVPLANSRLTNFYGTSSSSYKDTPVAPSYGSLARAEMLREQFYHDVLSATAVYCLPRNNDNTWKPAYISYDPEVDDELDTPQKFREHIIRVAGVSASLYLDFRNPGVTSTALATNASIFILSFSAQAKKMRVQAIYDIDVIRFSTGGTQPLGFHASVKRFTDPYPLPTNTTYNLVPAGHYSVFYPPANPAARVATDFAKDGFTPLFVTFERHTRLAQRESTAIDRFKLAAERPFYFIWWPDPAARHLGEQANTAAASLPQQAYNHMAGRTSFMFTVPMFPTL